jgi:sterol desaturase/sphingolipid hydroxylase (fatty acid hydroxylase superfamily)
MTIPILVAIALGMFAVERLWPANALPRVQNWWGRILLVNVIQALILVLAGITWDRWMQGASLIQLRDRLPDFPSALLTYFVLTFIYYGWHRIRHESQFFWRLCHQLHHSPARIEVFTSFYKHPVEITLNSLLSSAIAYPLMGCSVAAAAQMTFLTAIAEFFYHWNIRTPRAVGYFIQRPESHRIHHQYRHHTQNFADLPIWDMLFGTFRNADQPVARCGFDDWREDRFEDMLAFRDVHTQTAEHLAPFHFLPTCIGCSKRWACHQANAGRKDEAGG